MSPPQAPADYRPRYSAVSPSEFEDNASDAPDSQWIPLATKPSPVPAKSKSEAPNRLRDIVESRRASRVAQESLGARIKRQWPYFAGGALIIVVIALIAALALRPGPSKPTPTSSPSLFASLLAEPADLANVRPGATWTETTDLAPDDSKGMICLTATRGMPSIPTSVIRRTFTTATGEASSIVQQVETYSTAEEAARNFVARSLQLGSCPGAAAYITAGLAVEGAGDQAVGARVTDQSTPTSVHDLIVVRSGAAIMVLDAKRGTTAYDTNALLGGFTKSLTSICTASKGQCPSTPKVTDQQVPLGEPTGWLTPGDLPRINTGVGTWVGATISPMQLSGSRCENLDLTSVEGATVLGQRGYLLTGDANASEHFGIDEIVYTFSSAEAATAWSTKLLSNITTCSQRDATATVTPGPELSGASTGRVFVVDQRQTLNKTARYRVGVATAGTRVVYVSSNPVPTFDFTNESWVNVVQRAAFRTTQIP